MPTKYGAQDYSEWYTPKYARERFDEKQVALAQLNTDGDLEKAQEWNARAQRRFQAGFNRLSDETKRSYQTAARHFGKYIGLRDAKVSQIVARFISLSYIEACTLVEEYMLWMKEELDLSPNTINLRLAALKCFVELSEKVGWVDWKLNVKGVKVKKVRDTKGPSYKEFRRILRVVQRATGKTASRDKLLVYMLSFMALRITSALSLDYENIDFEECRFKVKWKGEENVLVWRPVGPEVMAALEEWLEQRGRHGGPIFSTFDPSKRSSGRLTRRTAADIIKEIGREAGTKKRLHPHAFRHFHTTDGLDATDGNTRKIMKSTGHKSIRMIEEYDDGRKDEAREVTENMERRWLNIEDDEPDEDEGVIDGEEEGEAEEEDDNSKPPARRSRVVSAQEAVDNPVELERISTGIDGVDEVLGGGLVLGSLILLGGFPGIGKSTLARQMAKGICESNNGMKVLMASGEETVGQIAEALKRIKSVDKNLLLFSGESINEILEIAEEEEVDAVFIDSVSTVAVDDIGKKPGSITQVKAVGRYIKNWVKGIGNEGDDEYSEGSGIPVVIVSHVDKKGQIAGPKALEHYVDAVLTFEGQPNLKVRMLTQNKNRFANTMKMARFDMTKHGLEERPLPTDVTSVWDDDDEDEEDQESGLGLEALTNSRG